MPSLRRHIRVFVGLVVASAWTASVSAQAISQIDSIMTIRTPLSPAFALMGISPVSIERPTTPRAFSLALLSATQSGSRLPNSLAIEVAPFWLTPQPLFNYQQFYNAPVVQSIKQSFSISIATVRRDTSTNATDLGIGFRAQPVPGQESGASIAHRDTIRMHQRAMVHTNAARRAAEDTIKKARAGAIIITTSDTVRLLARVDTLTAIIDSLVESTRTQVDRLRENQERIGLSVDVAGAWNLGFPTDSFDGGRTAGVGVWATAGYRWEDPQFQLLGLGRFIRDVRAEDQNLIDLGTRLIWSVNRFALSVEGVRRIAADVDAVESRPGTRTISFRSSGRIVGTFEYELNSDMYFYASFGKDHDAPTSGRNKLLATAGLSLDFGSRPTLLRTP